MTTVSKFASSNAVVTTGWTSPTNAYADDTSYATAAINSKNTSITSDFGFASFTTGDIPDGAQINSVTVEILFFSNTTGSTNAVLGLELFNNAASDAAETTYGMSLAEVTQTKTFSTVPSLTDLRTAGRLQARVRGNRASSNTAITWSLDYVKITVDYSVVTTVTGSVTADAYIKKTQQGSLTADANIKATISGSVTADAYLLKTQQGSVTADAYVQRTFSSSFTADAQISGSGVPAPTWVSPADGTLISTTPTLVFTIPAGGPAGNYHFHIQLDTANTFNTGNLRDVKTNISQTGWEYNDGAQWQPFPSGGVASTYAGNQARYTVQSPLSSATWYRRVRGGM